MTTLLGQTDSLERRLLSITVECEQEITAYIAKLDEMQEGFHAFVRARQGILTSTIRKLLGIKDAPAYTAEALHDYLWLQKKRDITQMLHCQRSLMRSKIQIQTEK